jgi:hypothetical protein
MRVFANPVGSGSLWFDNLATADGTPVAYDPQARAFLPMPPFCANREIIGCNWIAPEQGAFCRSCAMTALGPDVSIPNAIPNWAQTEAAKRWALDNLGRWRRAPLCRQESKPERYRWRGAARAGPRGCRRSPARKCRARPILP